MNFPGDVAIALVQHHVKKWTSLTMLSVSFTTAASEPSQMTASPHKMLLVKLDTPLKRIGTGDTSTYKQADEAPQKNACKKDPNHSEFSRPSAAGSK